MPSYRNPPAHLGTGDYGMATYTLLVLAWLLLPCDFAVADSAKHRDEMEESVLAEIKLLTHDRFSVREEAARRLSQRVDALPYLLAASRTGPVELSSRCNAIVKTIVTSPGSPSRKHFATLAETGRADVLIDKATAFGFPDLDEYIFRQCSQMIINVVEHESAAVRSQFYGTVRGHKDWIKLSHEREAGSKSPFGGFYAFSHDVVEVTTTNSYPATAYWNLRVGGFHFPVERRDAGYSIISTGDVRMMPLAAKKGNAPRAGFFLSNGSIVMRSCKDVVIIADGDIVGPRYHPKTDFRQENGFFDCLLICRGYIHGDFDKSIARAGHDIVPTSRPLEICLRTDRSPRFATFDNGSGFAHEQRKRAQGNLGSKLGFIRFFETMDVGIEAKAVGERIQVTRIQNDSPFHQKQVKAGCFVESINGKKITLLDEFRRLLRRAVAEEGGVFRFRVGDYARDVLIPFPPALAKPKEK